MNIYRKRIFFIGLYFCFLGCSTDLYHPSTQSVPYWDEEYLRAQVHGHDKDFQQFFTPGKKTESLEKLFEEEDQLSGVSSVKKSQTAQNSAVENDKNSSTQIDEKLARKIEEDLMEDIGIKVTKESNNTDQDESDIDENLFKEAEKNLQTEEQVEEDSEDLFEQDKKEKVNSLVQKKSEKSKEEFNETDMSEIDEVLEEEFAEQIEEKDLNSLENKSTQQAKAKKQKPKKSIGTLKEYFADYKPRKYVDHDGKKKTFVEGFKELFASDESLNFNEYEGPVLDFSDEMVSELGDKRITDSSNKNSFLAQTSPPAIYKEPVVQETNIQQKQTQEQKESEFVASSKEEFEEEQEGALQKSPVLRNVASLKKEVLKTWMGVSKVKTIPFRKGKFLANAVYIVRPGDSLALISDKIYQLSHKVDLLKKLNPHLKDQLKIGEPIYYQSVSRPKDESRVLIYYEDIGMSPKVYRVQPGQSLKNVSKQLLKYPESWKEIWAINSDLPTQDKIQQAVYIKYWDLEAYALKPIKKPRLKRSPSQVKTEEVQKEKELPQKDVVKVVKNEIASNGEKEVNKNPKEVNKNPSDLISKADPLEASVLEQNDNSKKGEVENEEIISWEDPTSAEEMTSQDKKLETQELKSLLAEESWDSEKKKQTVKEKAVEEKTAQLSPLFLSLLGGVILSVLALISVIIIYRRKKKIGFSDEDTEVTHITKISDIEENFSKVS